LPQAEALDTILAKYKLAIGVTLSLEVDEDELYKRISLRGKLSGRADDQDRNTFVKRMNVYASETFPLKEYYNKKGVLRRVRGVGNIDDIFKMLCNELEMVH